MGGLGSGRRTYTDTIEDCLVFDLPMLMRRGWVCHGRIGSGQLSWTERGRPCASIGYRYDLTPQARWELRLSFACTRDRGVSRQVEQHIALTLTRPNYGGVRWWMRCPVTGKRATKLYMPPGSDQFGHRTAWGLGYASQREPERLKCFERLFRLQHLMGLSDLHVMPPYRPKGMWHRTFARHEVRWLYLQRQCSVEMSRLEDLM